MMSPLFTFSCVFNPGGDDQESRTVAIPLREVAEVRSMPYGPPYATEIVRRYPCGRTVRIPCGELVEVLVRRFNDTLGPSPQAATIGASPTRA